MTLTCSLRLAISASCSITLHFSAESMSFQSFWLLSRLELVVFRKSLSTCSLSRLAVSSACRLAE